MKGSWDADRDPLTALQAGDGSLFEAFVRAETGTFLGYFGRLGAGAEEAEDLTQELFLKLYKSASGYRPQSYFTAYAMRIAKNAWIDRGRRRTTRPTLASLSSVGGGAAASGVDEVEGPTLAERLEGPPADPARPLLIREDLARFRAALTELSQGQREVFELAVLQELSYADVSELLEIPVGTVKSRVFHALRRLRELMEAAG